MRSKLSGPLCQAALTDEQGNQQQGTSRLAHHIETRGEKKNEQNTYMYFPICTRSAALQTTMHGKAESKHLKILFCNAPPRSITTIYTVAKP